MKQRTFRQAFDELVAPHTQLDSDTGCWLVNLADNGHGYVRVIVNGNPVYAHQLSYLSFKGAIPQGRGVCHSCDRRNCVNPEHLFAGTQKENLEDMTRKGRRKAPHFAGETNPAAKITAEIAARIKESPKQGKDLAVQYGISKSTVSAIRCGKIWRLP